MSKSLLFVRYLFDYQGEEIRIEQETHDMFSLSHGSKLIGRFTSAKLARVGFMKSRNPDWTDADLNPGFLPTLERWKFEEFDGGVF